MNQRWGTAKPITIRDKDFGAGAPARLRRLFLARRPIPRTFHTKVSGTRETYTVADIEGQLRQTIIGRMSDAFAESGMPVPRHGRQPGGTRRADPGSALRPLFAELGLALDSFVVRKSLAAGRAAEAASTTRVGMNMIGDMGRYTQFQVAQSMPIAAANEGGIAGIGAGLAPDSGWRRRCGSRIERRLRSRQQPPPPQAPPPVARCRCPSRQWLRRTCRTAGCAANGRSRRRNEVLRRMRQQDPACRQVLPRVWTAAAGCIAITMADLTGGKVANGSSRRSVAKPGA